MSVILLKVISIVLNTKIKGFPTKNILHKTFKNEFESSRATDIRLEKNQIQQEMEDIAKTLEEVHNRNPKVAVTGTYENYIYYRPTTVFANRR